MQINQPVIDAFPQLDLTGAQTGVAPKLALPSCLSEAQIALWTNRVPMHEPWPRVIKLNASKGEEDYKKNTDHVDQFQPLEKDVNRKEGDEIIDRNKLWRR